MFINLDKLISFYKNYYNKLQHFRLLYLGDGFINKKI